LSPQESAPPAAVRRQAGRGIASRFTIGLGLFAVLFAAPATWLLIRGTMSLSRAAADGARRQMASKSAALEREGVELRGTLSGRQFPAEGGATLLVADSEVDTRTGKERLRVYRVTAPGSADATGARDYYAPETVPVEDSKIVVLVLMVTGGLVGVTILFAALTARRVAEPLKEMTEDVLTISHGRLGHRIRTGKGMGELVLLARAVERMVKDLVEGQETRAKLERRQRDVAILREMRRALRSMVVEPPPGYSIDSAVVEAAGAGSGDFVDTLVDDAGRPTLVVGATASRGLAGAMLMAMARAYLRVAVLGGAGPAEACDAANLSLNRDLARGLYASAMLARLEPASGQVELVSAGHKAPAVRWDVAAGQFRKLQPNGIALAFDAGPVFRKSLERLQLELKPGDALFLFSPGIFQTTNADGQELGEKGVYTLAKIAVEEGLEAMRKRLVAFLGAAPEEDLAFALMKRLPEVEEDRPA